MLQWQNGSAHWVQNSHGGLDTIGPVEVLRAELRSPGGTPPPASCTGCRRCGVFLLRSQFSETTNVYHKYHLLGAHASVDRMYEAADEMYWLFGKSYVVLLQVMTVGKASRLRSTPLHAAARAVRQAPVACVQAGILRRRGASAASAATTMPVRYTRCGF
jgi:hypothetical protein